jgi:hypothetical protein
MSRNGCCSSPCCVYLQIKCTWDDDIIGAPYAFEMFLDCRIALTTQKDSWQKIPLKWMTEIRFKMYRLQIQVKQQNCIIRLHSFS